MHHKPGLAVISATIREITELSLNLSCFRCKTRQMLCGIPKVSFGSPVPESAHAHSRPGGQTFTAPNAHCPSPGNSVPEGTALQGEKRSPTTPWIPPPHGTGARLRWSTVPGGQRECAAPRAAALPRTAPRPPTLVASTQGTVPVRPPRQARPFPVPGGGLGADVHAPGGPDRRREGRRRRR